MNLGNELFVEGEYDGDEAYEDENGNPLGRVEGKEEISDEESLYLFEEQKEEESLVIATKVVHRASRGVDRHPLNLSPIEDRKYIKGPFIVENEETHILPHVIASRVDPIDSPPAHIRKRKEPFEEEGEDNDEARNLLDGEVKEGCQGPLAAAVSAPNATEASAKVDHFVDEEVAVYDDLNGLRDDGEDGYTPSDDNWEDREAQRYLEMLQEQENGMQDDTLQCPICNVSLQRIEEDVSCTAAAARCWRCRLPI